MKTRITVEKLLALSDLSSFFFNIWHIKTEILHQIIYPLDFHIVCHRNIYVSASFSLKIDAVSQGYYNKLYLLDYTTVYVCSQCKRLFFDPVCQAEMNNCFALYCLAMQLWKVSNYCYIVKKKIILISA